MRGQLYSVRTFNLIVLLHWRESICRENCIIVINAKYGYTFVNNGSMSDEENVNYLTFGGHANQLFQVEEEK